MIWHSWCIKDTNSAALCVFSHSSTTLLRPAMDPLCSGLSSKLDMICLEREPNHSNAYYLQKKNRQCRHYWHRLGKDFVFFAPPNGCRDTQHSIWRTKEERLFSGDQVVGRQKPECHQEYCSNICGGCMVTMVTIGGDLQPGCLADRLLTGLGQPQINP